MAVVVTSPYVTATGNGAATSFPFALAARNVADVAVYVNGALQTVGFSVTLNADFNGGTVLFTTAPANAATVLIAIQPSLAQPIKFVNSGPYNPSTVDGANDAAAIRDIYLQGQIGRAPLVPLGETMGPLPSSASRLGKFFGFDALGNPVALSGTGNDSALRTDLAASGGASLVGTNNGATGSRTVTAKAKGEYHLDAREFAGTWDGVADDTTGLQAAANEAIVRNATLHIPKGVKAGAISISGPCKIQGEGGKSTINSAAGSYVQFNISSSDVSITDLVIQALAKTGGANFNIACGTATLERIAIKNILSWDAFAFLTDSGSGAGQCITQNFEEIQARRLRGPGIAVTRLFAHGFWRRLTMEFVGVSASNFTAFSVDGAALTSPGGLTLDDCNAAGTAGTFANTSQIGFDLKNFSDIKLNARADSMGGDGFRYTSINKLTGDAAFSQLCDGHQHVFTGVTNSCLDQVYAQGRNGLSGTASKDGIRFVSGCSVLTLGNVISRDVTGDDVSKVAAQAGPVLIGLLQADAATGIGIRSVGNSPFVVAAAILSGNSANYNLAGTSDYLRDVMLNSGSMTDVGPGPVSG